MQNLINEIIESQMDSIVIINETIFQLTSSFNQNNKIYKNISSIKLKEYMWSIALVCVSSKL